MRQRQFYNSSVSRAKSGNDQASNEVYFFFKLALRPATLEVSLLLDPAADFHTRAVPPQ